MIGLKPKTKQAVLRVTEHTPFPGLRFFYVFSVPPWFFSVLVTSDG